MKRGLFVAPFDELSDPGVLMGLAVRAERAGWDGVFLWDHVVYREPVRAVADSWVCLSAMAVRTERIALGPLVTPPARRRPWKLAREAATLQRLSGGRLILGLGLGGDGSRELSEFGEQTDDRVRASMLDEAIAVIEACLSGSAAGFEGEHYRLPPRRFEPTADVPLWLASRYPARRPVRRAARHDGLFPIDLPGPDGLRELVEIVRTERGSLDGFDIVVTDPPGTDPEPWRHAGATWLLTGWDSQPQRDEVLATADAGP